MAKDEARKNAVWTYNFNTHSLSVLFPNDQRENFDLSTLVDGMNQQQEIVYQYGFKQLMSSNWAAEKTVADKVKSAQVDYEDLLAGKAVIIGEGKIGFAGRTRANSAPKTIDKAVEAKFTTLTLEEVDSMLTLATAGIVPISAELKTKLEARLAELTQ